MWDVDRAEETAGVEDVSSTSMAGTGRRAAVGLLLGEAVLLEGDAEGGMVGLPVGWADGVRVGLGEGDADGLVLGVAVGRMVGGAVGCTSAKRERVKTKPQARRVVASELKVMSTHAPPS